VAAAPNPNPTPAFQRVHERVADAGRPSKILTMAPAPTTLAALFEAEESPLLRFALGLVGRRSVAEELVQEAFLRLHPIWAEVEQPRPWLYRCVRNLALNHLRDNGRETIVSEPPEPGPAGRGAPAPDETFGRMEAVGMVRMLVAELEPDDRDLVRMKYDEGLKYAEISARTGVNAGTIGYRLHHLLKRLADQLRHAGIEGSEG
jgi:RNA polymerase sigma factor (sigma-70 family)